MRWSLQRLPTGERRCGAGPHRRKKDNDIVVGGAMNYELLS